MPRAGLFWKLFFSTVLLSTVAVTALLLAYSVQRRETARQAYDARLDAAAATAAALAARDWPARATRSWQATLKQIAERTAVRVTLIAADGRPVADSRAASLAELAATENLASRVEIVEARRQGAGWSTRRAQGSDTRYRYRSLRVVRDGELLGFVRTALPIDVLEASIARDQRRLWFVGLLFLGLVASGSYAVAAYTVRPLIAIQQAAQAIAEGDYLRRLPYSSHPYDEISKATQALAEVGKRLSQRETELRRTHETQTAVLEAMNESIVAMDCDLRILFANRAARVALPCGDQLQDHATLLEAVRSRDLQEMAEQVLATGEVVRRRWQWPDRHARAYDVLATPLPGEPSQGVLLVLHDISELTRLEEMRQQFVANVSHELKTPLSSIKAYTETLLGGTVADNQQQRRFLARIEEQANRLHQLIQDMLSLARIEAGQVQREQVCVRVAPVVAACLADHRRVAETQQVALVNRVEDGNLAIVGDEESLRQILDNLVDNAVKYTPEGGEVAVSARRHGDTLDIVVADTGVGIAAEHHERVFQRFYRVDKARSRELGGTGLGLAIVKHLCGAMGGAVAVESQPGKGSLFRVTLPAVGPEQAD